MASAAASAAAPLPQYVTTRQDVIKELYESEIAFQEVLTFVVETYHPGFAAAKCIPEDHALCQTIFGGIMPIRSLSRRLCLLFEKAIRENASDPMISPVFLETADEFVCFSQYISNQPAAIACYNDCMVDRRTSDGMKILLASKQAKSKSYADIFALIFQRICRYGLFLDRITKVTDESHPERADLLLASQKMQEIVKKVNALRGEQDRKVKLQEVARMIEFNGDYPEFPIVVPGREIIHHGPMSKLRTLFNRPLYFFVFNDTIVYCSEQKSLFRSTRYSVAGVFKIDQYFKATKHDKASDSRNYISIFESLQHIGRHYDALNRQNMDQFLQAFDRVCTEFAVQFIQAQAKKRADENKALCPLCSRILSRFGRNTCPFCQDKVCSDCFSCEFHHRRCCTKCGEARGIVQINPRLIPHSRSYQCTTPYISSTSNPRMISLAVGDSLDVYLNVNQRWALGRNNTQNTVGVFPLHCCLLDRSQDRGTNQNFALFAGVFDPQNKAGAKNNFPVPLETGDLIAVTYDNSEGWYYGMSLKTEKFGWVHYSDLLLVQNTEIRKKKYR